MEKSENLSEKAQDSLHDLITNGGSTTSPKSNAPFFVVSLASHNSNPIIPDAFFTTHLDGNNELTKLKLTSDACDTTWQVKLNGRRFADGWEDFSNAHCLRNDDVLLFREDGEMIFHVTPSGRSFSQIHYIYLLALTIVKLTKLMTTLMMMMMMMTEMIMVMRHGTKFHTLETIHRRRDQD
ncbi:hypothetical protein YC2023_007677 [Brassica napus]